MKFTLITQKLTSHSLLKTMGYFFVLAGYHLGFIKKLVTQDRKVLENIVFPYYGKQKGFDKILFIGIDWFTRPYENILAGKEFWTIDIDPKKAQFAGNHHIVDSIEYLPKHIQDNYFDLIICNGVIGWGLNTADACDASLKSCHQCLRPGGHLVLGWNDDPRHCPFTLDNLQSLKLFYPFVFPEFDAFRYLANPDNRHFFDFYYKQ